MADDVQSLQSLNWRALFPFLNLFRAFRIAIHPSKLILGFLLVTFLYAGGHLLDRIWLFNNHVLPGEIDGYQAYRWNHEPGSFADLREAQANQAADFYAQQLVTYKIFKPEELDKAREEAPYGGHRAELIKAMVLERDTKTWEAQQKRDKDLQDIEERKYEHERVEDVEKHKTERETDKKNTRRDYEKTIRDLNAGLQANFDQIYHAVPLHIFDVFQDYESRQFEHVVDSALSWNWLSGVMPARAAAPAGVESAGVLRSLSNLLVIGPTWLLRYHFFYFLIYIVWFLIIWAIFGGAISRVAAIHAARDEKISIRQALRFSSAKLLSFVFAIVIPLLIILGGGLAIAVGGLLLYVPVIGPILVGALFLLALLVGFVIALTLTATVGGFNLMYPTIAVEGSDSFDAVSRSFSYVFARPWKMLFYSALSLIYGALTFIFIRYFIYIILAATHFFVGAFLVGRTGEGWSQMWPLVGDQDLTYRINFQALTWDQATGAALVAFWVYILLTFLAAYVISFYFSANTLIYYLMRNAVDAVELNDVFVEEGDEELDPMGETPEASPAPVAAPVSPAEPPPTMTPTAPPP